MKYQFFYDPVTHLIVEDFFDPLERKFLMELIKKSEHLMKVGEMSSGLSPKKKNLNLWVYNYPNDLYCVSIANTVEKKIWSKEMKKIFLEVKDSLFQYYHYTNFSDILVSKYTKGDKYDWHDDLLKSLTGNIWLSDDIVEGGDLYLKSNFDEVKKIKYQDNTCIFFPSECRHMVSPVENDAERYSIQYFAQRKF